MAPQSPPVTEEFSRAATKLLVSASGEDGESAKQIADRGAEAFTFLSQHLSRLLGQTGIETLLKRSMVLASAQYPWLVAAASTTQTNACSTLRVALEQQDSDSATDGFVAVLWMFVGLLKRLIGEGLVERLLHEVWPAIFAPAAKETP